MGQKRGSLVEGPWSEPMGDIAGQGGGALAMLWWVVLRSRREGCCRSGVKGTAELCVLRRGVGAQDWNNQPGGMSNVSRTLWQKHI